MPRVSRTVGVIRIAVAVLVAAGAAATPAATIAATTEPDPRPQTRPAIDRAASWLAAFPVDRLRFDAAVGLAAIRRRVDGAALRVAWKRARSVADRDPDNPLRRFFDETYSVPVTSTSRWKVPGPGQPRVNVNRVVVEALFCDENGLRPETLAYATGPMRDGGGYQTTHAVWALVLARDRDCLPRADFLRLAGPLLRELREAQPPAPARDGALAVDLFAERLLMLLLAGGRDARVDAWAAALRKAQGADGGFGTAAPEEAPFYRYHATLVSAWALAEWGAAAASR
jgi:hypothetical protein